MYWFKHNIPRSNLQIAEWTNKTSIARESYANIARQKFNLYFTSSCPLIKDYMETKRSEWEEDKESTAEQLRFMALNKYNNLLNSWRWSNKDPKDDQILALVVVAQKLAEDSNKSSDKSTTSNRDPNNGEKYYTRDFLPWITEDPKVGLGNITKDRKEYWW